MSDSEKKIKGFRNASYLLNIDLTQIFSNVFLCVRQKKGVCLTQEALHWET